MLNIRLMTPEDIAAVIAIQATCYGPDAIENESIFRARLGVSAHSAWVAEDERGVCAYLVAYPSQLGKVTPLGSNFDIPKKPTTLYLHDLAVSQRVAGQGVGSRLVHFGLESGRRLGLATSSLVSIQDSGAFWRRHGYTPWNQLNEQQQKHLETYPGTACYLVRDPA